MKLGYRKQENTFREYISPPNANADDFQIVMGTSLSEHTPQVKFSLRSYQFFHRYEPNCGKQLYLAVAEKSFKNFLGKDPDVADFQILKESSLRKDTSPVKFSLRFDQQVLCEVANTQTNRHMLGKHNRLCRSKK